MLCLLRGYGLIVIELVAALNKVLIVLPEVADEVNPCFVLIPVVQKLE